MKKHSIFFAVVLLTASTLQTSCSNDDMTIENPTEQAAQSVMTFTATLAPKDGTATTRSVDADGVTAWQIDEQIAVYYEKANDTYGTVTANVDAVKDGKATISASLTDAKNGGTVKFVYPAALLDETNGDIDATKLATQHGTIDDISAHFDAATGSGTLVTDGTSCGTDGTVTLTNQMLIGKFIPKYDGTPIDGIATLTVSDGTNTYAVTPTSGTFGTTGIYVAMLPVDDKEITVTASTSTDDYGFGGKKITLAVGKLYNNLAIAMGKKFDLATASFTGNYDAYIYQTDAASSATSNTITIAAGKKVILAGVNISSGDNNAIACSGSANIVLSGTNTVTGGSTSKAAIKAGPAETTLTISGCGTLSAQQAPSGNANAACIGADNEGTCGNITIKSGTVTATMTGSTNAAAIGTGCAAEYTKSSCGTITISGGTVTATAGNYGAAIGTGYPYYDTPAAVSCDGIVITGGTVTARANGPSAAIGSGSTDNEQASQCGNITISGGTVDARSIHNGKTVGAAIGAGRRAIVGNITISGSAVVTAESVGVGAPGIGGARGSSYGNIEISGSASVTAQGSDFGAGIGSGSPMDNYNPVQGSYGDITISTTGTVTATGGSYAAGIGAGRYYRCGRITITSGTIVATAGLYAAGIGAGSGADNEHLSICGSINITGGTVTAIRGDDSEYVYDIGQAMWGDIKDGDTDGTVTIDASVTTSNGKHYTIGYSNLGYNKEP